MFCLPVSGGAVDDMHGGAGVFVGIGSGPVHHRHVVDGEGSLVGMLVGPEGDVDAVLEHEVVEAVGVDAGESRPV